MARAQAFRLSDGEPIHVYQDVSVITLAFDERGPVGGGFTIPSGNAGARHDILRPDGYAALIALDARDEGVPWAWLGQAGPWGEDENAGRFDVSCDGPWDGWLSEVPVVDLPSTRGNASDAAWYALRRTVVEPPHHLVPGSQSGGAVIDTSSSGASAASMIADLAKRAGEEVAIRPVPGKATARLDWYNAFDVPDARNAVTLVPGRNCAPGPRGGDWSAGVDQLAGIANPVYIGRALMGSTVSYAVRPTIGRRARLAASQHVHVAQRLAAGQPIVRPDLPSAAAMVGALRSGLASASPAGEAAFSITDSSLYPYMIPRTLVNCVLQNDSTGLYARSELQITTATWTVADGRVVGLQISGRLWAAGEA